MNEIIFLFNCQWGFISEGGASLEMHKWFEILSVKVSLQLCLVDSRLNCLWLPIGLTTDDLFFSPFFFSPPPFLNLPHPL